MTIELTNVEKIYGAEPYQVHALRGINLTVDKGQFVVVAGPSGSGKTTLLNVIGTLDTVSEGNLTFDGKEVSGLSETEKADFRLHSIGFIFQAYNLINVLNAEENVHYVLQLQGVKAAERRSRARELLKQVGLEGMENRRPEQLSGGQQQRVAIARALAANPSIVLADEPTANLDQETGKNLMDIMLRLNEEHGITFIISSHDQMVMNRTKRLILMLDGQISEDTTGVGQTH